MYCPSCANPVKDGLKYCNSCGARVVPEEGSAVAENLSSALPYIGVFGFMGFIAVIYLMLRSPIISPGTIMLVSFFYLATLFGICFLILRQATGPMLKGKSGGTRNADDKAYLPAAATARLGESTEQPISVTEVTTKSLNKRKG